MKLSTVQQKFILHWGEMGTRWGINRTVAQIHALLYLSPQPLHAEEITETLAVARSNVSQSLRELQNWGLVQSTHMLGDRRAHFATEKDVWTLFLRILEERKRREIDPTIATLRQCLAETDRQERPDPSREPLQQMLEFFELTSRWYEAIDGLPKKHLIQFIKLGDRIPKAIGKSA